MAKYELLLPKMGESVAEATVIKWLKNPGDYIEADEAVMEIATDKVDSDVPSQVSGKLIQQLYKDNDVVQVGAVIAIIETAEPEPLSHPVSQDDVVTDQVDTNHEQTVEPVKEPQAETPETTLPEEPVSSVEEMKPETESIPGIEQLPQEQKVENELASLRFYSPLVKNIAAQEGIGQAELDKIPGTGADGRLTKDDLLNYVLHKAHQPEPVASKTPDAAETKLPETAYTPAEQPAEATLAAAVETMPENEPEHQELETPPQETTEPEQITAAADEPVGHIVESVPPPVVAAAEEPAKPQPAESIKSSTYANVETPKAEEPVKTEAKPAERKPSVSVSGGDEIIEMDRMRRLIADHMVNSTHTSPHVTSFVEADVTNLVQWREKNKNSFEQREGEKITFTPIFIEAVVKAIKDFPMINVSVDGTRIIKKKDINIGMATALPSGNLIVPVIKKADERSLLGLTKAVNDLANRSRNNKLLPDDVKDGTFTITNVGSFGNVMGTPIINQPQVAILAVGAIKKKPAVIETPEGDLIGIRHMMFLSLSYDHRVVDGALGGSFLRKIADYLEGWDANRTI